MGRGKEKGSKRRYTGKTPTQHLLLPDLTARCAASLLCPRSGIRLLMWTLLSLTWLCSCLQIPTEDDRLEVKDHTYSPLYPTLLLRPRQLLNWCGFFFLSAWNGHWVKSLRVGEGGVTGGKPPTGEKLGWIQGGEESVAESRQQRSREGGRGGTGGPGPGHAPSPLREPSCPLPGHDLFNGSCV